MGRIFRVLATVACGLAVACGEHVEEVPAQAVATNTPPPTSREGFLAELVPLPFDALVIVYEVRGPAGLHGTMEVLARPGGYRRHNWRLQLPLAGADPVLIEGSSVANPEMEWSEQGDLEPRVRPRPLGTLADAYVAASPQTRAAVIETVRRWHADVAAGRTQHPGPTDTILGIECLDTQLAAQRLCVWEQTGLALRVHGSDFSLDATHIETDPELGQRAFDVPVDPRPSAAIDSEATLRSLADGDVAMLAMLTTAPLAARGESPAHR
jgi:hypothetical protein